MACIQKGAALEPSTERRVRSAAIEELSISSKSQDRILVLGGGPAGLAAALCMALKGAPVSLLTLPVRANAAPVERRTAALFTGSIALLRNLGVWDACAPASAVITGVRIIDDTGGLLKAPEVVFTAAEAGLDAFGYNVPNDVLTAALSATLRSRGGTIIREAEVLRIEAGTSIKPVELTLADGTSLVTPLLAGADGRASPSRKAAGIETRSWSYPQTALISTFAHTRPHRGVSTEFHRPAGPMTTVPLPGNRSSLVWVERPDKAQQLLSLNDADFIATLENRLQGLLGDIHDVTPRAAFPLSGQSAETAGKYRVALVGEAMHVIPPIGAQGLNLGLRDAAVLADCIASARADGRDPGAAETLDEYSKARATDVATRVIGVDLLNRSLIADILPTHLARGFGLHVLSAISPLRRFVVREGLHPSSAIPSLMQNETRPAAPHVHRSPSAS